MAVPYDQTVAELCRTALRRAGQPAPSAGLVQEAVSNQFQEVKNDIRRKSDTHPLLETTSMTVTTIGVPEYAQPADANKIKSVLLYDGPTTMRGNITGSGGSAPNITSLFLAASLSGTSSDYMLGKKIFLLSGLGAIQHSYIRTWSSTTAGISPNIAVAPDTTTVYQVADYRNEIYNRDKQTLNHNDYTWGAKGRPSSAAVSGETLYMSRPPDKIYPLIWTYYVDIEKLDETDDRFIKILREWRSLFMAGVTAKSMILHDETRANDMILYYEGLLDKLGEKSLEVIQTVPYDPTYR